MPKKNDTVRTNTINTNTILQNPAYVANEPPIIPRPQGPVSAARYIEVMKKRMIRPNPNVFVNDVMRIIAAREIAASDRGHKDKLVSTIVTEEQISKRVSQMKQNSTIMGFVDQLRNDPAYRSEAFKCIRSRGHCGGLDDMLREYAKNVPPGELENTAAMRRYMPTVKERIEGLQNQFDPIDADMMTSIGQHKLVMEILALRHYSKANGGTKKELERKISTKWPNLKEKMQNLTENDYENVRRNLSPEGKRAVMSKNADKLVGKFRAESSGNNSTRSGTVGEFLFETNIDSRIGELQLEADDMAKILENMIKQGNPEKIAVVIAEAKNIIGEAIILDEHTRNPRTKETDESKMVRKDVPWAEVTEMVNKKPDSYKWFRTTFENYKPEDFVKALRKFGQTDCRELHTFSEYVNRKKVKLAARAKTQPKAGAKVNAQMKAGVKAKVQPKQNPVLPH